MVHNKIGKTLRNMRRKNLLSIKDVQKMFEDTSDPINAKTIYKWENGEVIPDMKTLNKLSYFYNCSMSMFFDNQSKCQALTDAELEFISKIRVDKDYRKIISLIIRKKKGEINDRIIHQA